MSTKNELSKKIERNLKNVFQETMKFNVISNYDYKGEINITVHVIEAHENYFKNNINSVYGLDDEVYYCLNSLINEFKREFNYNCLLVGGDIKVIN